ncbi:MAG TPA: peptidoglycan DD-metalloendopeptidase family protein [Terriglobia bacterium]|nr:peptidoglycan DD-metalloendopeptidase family protein [Terriglobia bacterium]
MNIPTSISGIGALDRGSQPQRPENLKSATEEFEAMFLGYLLKVMRSTVDQQNEDGGLSMGKDIYTDLFDNEIALTIARTRPLGIGEMMYRQLEEDRRDLETRVPESAATTAPAPVIHPTEGPVETPEDREAPGMFMPVDGRLSSGFGFRRDPLTGAAGFHKGLDIAAAAGAPIRAATAGAVVFSGWMGDYGNTIVIEHPGGERTLYAHAATTLVRPGDHVAVGDVIGLVGTTGRSTGPHLHFEVQVSGQAIDPTLFMLDKDSVKVPADTER